MVQQLNVPSSSITFDQPLFTKAFEISKAAEMNTVIRSGGFHLLVLFLGGIGTIMEDCRLAETMETIMHRILLFICWKARLIRKL